MTNKLQIIKSVAFKRKPLMFGLLATAIAAGSVYAVKRHVDQKPSLYSTLDYYGIKNKDQKEALRYLMQNAGIPETNALLDSKAKDPDALLQSILDFVQVTQKYFTIRTGTQERWDVKTSEWMNDPNKQTKALDALKQIGMIDAVKPTLAKRDAICILGASNSVMNVRLEYAGNLYSAKELPADLLILLAGERYVTPDKNGIIIDGSQEELKAFAIKLGKSLEAVTETDLMYASYQKSALNNKLTTVIIDTPRRDLPRPTTETTVMELCGWLKRHPHIQTITFVSNQPHVEYQRAIITQVFEREKMPTKFEVIGAEFTNSPVKNTADQINYLAQALGSRIWAVTPKVLDQIGIKEAQPQLIADYLEIYKKNPLIYNNMSAKFTPKPTNKP